MLVSIRLPILWSIYFTPEGFEYPSGDFVYGIIVLISKFIIVTTVSFKSRFMNIRLLLTQMF